MMGHRVFASQGLQTCLEPLGPAFMCFFLVVRKPHVDFIFRREDSVKLIQSILYSQDSIVTGCNVHCLAGMTWMVQLTQTSEILYLSQRKLLWILTIAKNQSKHHLEHRCFSFCCLNLTESLLKMQCLLHMYIAFPTSGV